MRRVVRAWVYVGVCVYVCAAQAMRLCGTGRGLLAAAVHEEGSEARDMRVAGLVLGKWSAAMIPLHASSYASPDPPFHPHRSDTGERFDARIAKTELRY